MNNNLNNRSMASQNIPVVPLTRSSGPSIHRETGMIQPAPRVPQSQSRGIETTAIGGVQIDISQDVRVGVSGKLIVVDLNGIPSYRFTTADGWMVAVQLLGKGETELEDKINAALSAAREAHTT